MGICPADGTIHLAFDHHCDPLHYRKSITGLATNPEGHSWVASNFGPVRNNLDGHSPRQLTYPRFITVPNGKLQLVYRAHWSGNGWQNLCEYDGSTGKWTFLGKYIDNPKKGNPYLHGITYDNSGRLHVVFNWRDSGNPNTNHDLYYIYSDDYGRTWKNNAGDKVGTTGSTYVTDRSPGVKVWSISRNRGYINQESATVDSQGRVHVLVSHLRDSDPDNTDFWDARANSYPFHYWRDTSGNWHKTQMPFEHRGGRGEIALDSNSDAYAMRDKLRIASASRSENLADWQIVDSSDDGRFKWEELSTYDSYRVRSDGKLSLYFLKRGKEKIYILDYKLAAGPVPTGTISGMVRELAQLLKSLFLNKIY